MVKFMELNISEFYFCILLYEPSLKDSQKSNN